MVVAYHAARLKRVHESILFRELPVKRFGILVVVPPAVKPDASHRAVSGEQFPQLGIHEAVISRPVVTGQAGAGVETRTPLRVVFPTPVYVGIINVET